MLENRESFKSFLPFLSASASQNFLLKCYRASSFTEAEQLSYQNSYPFMYYLEYAQTYYEQAELSPISIKPTLTFYGFTQLLKACLLTVEPNYPESTSELAHGVTARKRKKQQYEFLKDEVKIQRNGLFSSLSEKVFHMKHLEGEKFSMSNLLNEIPEMESIALMGKPAHFFRFYPCANGFCIAPEILDRFKMTLSRFEDFLTGKLGQKVILQNKETEIHTGVERVFSMNASAPIRYNSMSGHFALSANKDSKNYKMPELLLHYLVLYNLSMIARYETEWWAELLKMMPGDDYPHIVHFLHIHQRKAPLLVLEWLTKDRFDNRFI
ncbi:YaaC family protein [Bacillus massiliglaciei]|uniref:YaaC family protein n=1 Tax=Bacillus massiliglaciei TaxID=1816693 RepID=UPI000DA63AFB|nr:YaaC family protein [Bacillus massiliglaciei]